MITLPFPQFPLNDDPNDHPAHVDGCRCLTCGGAVHNPQPHGGPRTMPTPAQMRRDVDNLLAPMVKDMLSDMVSEAIETFRPQLEKVFLANAMGIPVRLILKAEGNTVMATIEMPEMPALDTECVSIPENTQEGK